MKKTVQETVEQLEVNIDRWKAEGKFDDKTEALVYAKPTRLEFETDMIRALLGGETIFDNCSFLHSEFKKTQVVEYLTGSFGQSGKRSLLILGGVGAGKTSGMLAYMVSQMHLAQAGAFITAYDLAMMIHKKDFEGLDRISKRRYLAIDDLGTEPQGFKGKDFLAHFENLFSERHRKMLYTFITCNGKVDDVKENYGERFASRFQQYGEVFETTDGDMRK